MELMRSWRKRMSERRTLRRLVALLAIGGVSMAMMTGDALAAETEGAEPAETPKFVLEDVVVTAERIPTKRMDTPANVAVITDEEIEANHYKTLGEALMHVNGVIVTSGNSNQDTSVRLNGDERVVVLVDGRRFVPGIRMDHHNMFGTQKQTISPTRSISGIRGTICAMRDKAVFSNLVCPTPSDLCIYSCGGAASAGCVFGRRRPVLELVNLSNANCDNEGLLGNSEGALDAFLREEDWTASNFCPAGLFSAFPL